MDPIKYPINNPMDSNIQRIQTLKLDFQKT